MKTCWNCVHRISKRTTYENWRSYCVLTKDVRSNTGHKRIKAKDECKYSDLLNNVKKVSSK